jgi:hypothetical protein
MLDETTHVIDERQLVLGLGFQLSESCLDDVAVVSVVGAPLGCVVRGRR